MMVTCPLGQREVSPVCGDLRVWENWEGEKEGREEKRDVGETGSCTCASGSTATWPEKATPGHQVGSSFTF